MTVKNDDEINITISREQKLRRTLIRVEKIVKDFEKDIVEVYVVGWRPRQTVRFPISLIPVEIQKNLVQGSMLIAYVNTGAVKLKDIVLERFELAPEPNDDDGLA